MIELKIPFTNPDNYIFDPDLVEIGDGVAKLKSRLPIDNEIFFAGYNVDLDANRGAGTLTGTGTGSPSASGGRLDLKGPATKYVDYNVNNLDDTEQTGAIRFRLVPNYDNAPAADRTIFTIADSASGNNEISLKHQADGQLNLKIANEDSTTIIDVDLGQFSAVQGREYEFELNYNLNDISGGEGLTELYIDGVQFGARIRDTLTRTSGIDQFRVGSDRDGTDQADFEISFFQIFDAVQNSADYTPADQPDSDYTTTDQTIIPAATSIIDKLVSVSAVETKPGSDQIRYILTKNGVKYWHNGAIWTISDGSYSQSNSIIVLNATAPQFTNSVIVFGMIAILRSADGSTTPILDEITFVHNFAGFAGDEIDFCYVYGNIVTNAGGDPSPVKVYLSRPFSRYKTGTIIRRLETAGEFTPRANDGYFNIPLIPTDQMEPGTAWIFEYADGVRESVLVPNSGTAKFKELTRDYPVNV